MSAATPLSEDFPPHASADAATAPDAFRPVLFALSSLTSDHVDAAVVARQLQTHFRPGNFYLINAAAFAAAPVSPTESKKGGSTAPTPSPESTAESIKAGVLAELRRIGAAREEAHTAAAQARAAQLAALQAEYEEDGLTADDALAAAQAELKEAAPSDNDEDGEGGEGDDVDAASAGPLLSRRLPPCVCLLNIPLSCTVMDQFVRAVPGVAAAVLLESRCVVRELVGAAGSNTQANAAGAAAGDRSKARSAGAGSSVLPPNGKSGSVYTDDLVEYLNGGAVQLMDDGAGLPNVLLQRVEYPTDGANPAALRPAVSSANFVASLHRLLLGIFQCWLRYEAWSEGRVAVRVPPYAPLRDADAAAAAEGGRMAEEPPASPSEQRLSKRKSAMPATADNATSSSAAGATASAAAAATTAATDAAVTAAYPRAMAEVAAERFEYRTFMQRWAAAQNPHAPHHHSDAALHAFLAAAIHQVGSPHGAATLRSRAETAAAQLQEDVRAASVMCADAFVVAGSSSSSNSAGRDGQVQELSTAASVEKVRAVAQRTVFIAGTTADVVTAASTVEAALAEVVAMGPCGGSDAPLSAVAAAVTSSPGAANALQWLRDALVTREQLGWRVASHRWGPADSPTTVCCAERPAAHVLRAAHTAFVFRGPTTFPQFFNDEAFLDAEGRVYELHSASSESEADEEDVEEDEDEGGAGDSMSDSASTTGSVNSGGPSAAAAEAEARKAAAAKPPALSAAPLIDYSAIVMRQLRRRRVFEQVRNGHARPATQEVGVSADHCRAAVTETNWMRAVDGTLVEMTRTVANSCQVRCTVADPSTVVRGGYALECPAHTAASVSAPSSPAAAASAADVAAPPPPTPAPTVESGVRGFLEVGGRLRVFTAVEADNSHAVEVAAHALAVAAAKEAAAAQYEAQFSKGAKAPKGREKSNPAASPLSLEEITATLLAALPAPPSAATTAAVAAEGDAPAPPPPPPPRMHVHALFPAHRCLVTSVASPAAVPGVRLSVLPDSAHTTTTATAPSLLTLHLWWEGQLCTVAVTRLSAVHVYVDGAAELFSPDLPPAVRVLLHPAGGYITEVGGSRLFVSARGCCRLVTGTEAAAAVVHWLQVGWAAAVTYAAVRRAEREDGMQQEFVAATPTSPELGTLAKTRFGPGVVVSRRAEPVGEEECWVWHVAGLPAVSSNRTARHVAAFLDDGGRDCWLYQPDKARFELRMKAGENSADDAVAATLLLRELRLVFWSGEGGFVVDCAYGGVCGVVRRSHMYRVSPFGRCTEEVAVTQNNVTQWQLVLPAAVKRPKRREAEALLPAQYASDAFHRAVGGTGRPRGESPSAAEASGRAAATLVEVLHLQRGPPLLLSELETTSGGGEGSSDISTTTAVAPLSFLSDAVATPAKPPTMHVCCAALHSDGCTATVMDSASWSGYVQWLARLPGSMVRAEAASAAGFAGQPFAVSSCVAQAHDLQPVEVVDADAPRRPSPPAQRCVALACPAGTSSAVPTWPSASDISAALEACRCVTEGDKEPHEADDVPCSGEEGGVSSNMDATPPPTAAAADNAETAAETQQLVDASPQEDNAQEVALPLVAAAAHPSPCRALNYWSSRCCPDGPLRESRHSPSAPNPAAPNTTAAASESGAKTAEARRTDAAAAAAAPPKSRTNAAAAATFSGPPLMRSYAPAADALSGTTASSRYHAPLLRVQPSLIDFGNVHAGRRYTTTFALTNASTVPCRYRIRADPAVRPFVLLTYSRQFVAPGMTVEVTVELSGWQPHGVVDAELTVVHEGGAAAVAVVWCTTDAVHPVQMGRNVVCVGWSDSKPALQHPAKTKRGEGEEEAEAGREGGGEESASDTSTEVPVL